jgi:hypothetical protein
MKRFEPTDRQRGQVEAMARYGLPKAEIARTIGVSKPTLLKSFAEEIETGATKANAQVGEFLFSTIIGAAIPGRTPIKDERSRVTAAIFWAKTRMNWRETSVHQHQGKDGGPIEIEVSAVRERIARRIARLSAASAVREDPEGSE